MNQQSIGKERAVRLADSKWWVGKTYREIAKFQLFTAELCCDFDVFHEALEKSLGRPIWTHEFANIDAIHREFLGIGEPPTLREIMDMIPAEKRILITVPAGSAEPAQ